MTLVSEINNPLHARLFPPFPPFLIPVQRPCYTPTTGMYVCIYVCIYLCMYVMYECITKPAQPIQLEVVQFSRVLFNEKVTSVTSRLHADSHSVKENVRRLVNT